MGEMTAVFHQAITDAPNNWCILVVSLRELRDWPMSCWREYQRSLGMDTTVIWINEHKRIWRTAVLVLLIIAMTGPWSFDLINVPAEYPCSLPNYRLEGDFCGIPFSGIWIFPVLFPLFTTLSLIRQGRRQSKFDVVIWGLALSVGLFFGVSFLARPHPQSGDIWLYRGVWLYIVVAAVTLFLELITLKTDHYDAQETAICD